MALGSLTLAALLFTGGHFLLSSPWLRPRLVTRLGEKGFLALYSLLMLLFFAWLLFSYARAPFIALWNPPAGMRHLALTLMPLATILLIGSLSPRNPTSVGAKPERLGTPAGIYAVTRHPMLWAFTLWALAHLAANGDAASVILFGSLLLLALPGTFVIDAKIRHRDRSGWAALTAHTSNIPLTALLQRRVRLRAKALAVPVVGGLLLYAVLLWAHPYLFGVSPLP